MGCEMSNNWWGPPSDDEEPLPDWMRADTYRNGGKPKPRGPSLEQMAADALKKPPVPIVIEPPKEFDK